ncbi:hypothetical protein [Nevskia ramosa]|uniref:hypothetical protein n=1 Tax=Nevskia ramosa TaxID=64002 RepID=UPI003D0D1970
MIAASSSKPIPKRDRGFNPEHLVPKSKHPDPHIARNAPPPPPLFYRDGRALTDVERGIAIPHQEEAEPTRAPHLAPSLEGSSKWSWQDWLIPVAVTTVIIGHMIAWRIIAIGLVMAVGTFGALAKAR